MALIYNFLTGGLSGMGATCITQPIDMIKVRIQLRGEAKGKTSPIDVAKEIYHQGGIKGFYRGIDSALARQAVYASLRIGLYYKKYNLKNLKLSCLYKYFFKDLILNFSR